MASLMLFIIMHCDKIIMPVKKKYIHYIYADPYQEGGLIPCDKRPACIFPENYRRNISLKKVNKK